MSNPEYLDFDNEYLDDGAPIVAYYGSQWARWLLGVAKQLTNPDIWDPDSQVDLAVQYANELVVRLMGGDIPMAQKLPVLPMFCLPFNAVPLGGGGVELFLPSTGEYFISGIRSDSVAEVDNWCEFQLWLPAGDWRFAIYTGYASGRGKMTYELIDALGDHSGELDLYSATPVFGVQVYMTPNIPEEGYYTLRFGKNGKNAGSSGGRVVLFGFAVYPKP